MPHLPAVDGGREQVPSRAEVLRDGPIGGEEALGVPRGFEAPHVPFPLARRLVGVFSPIVEVTVLPVFDARQDLPLGSPVAFQPIGDDDPWEVPASFEELAEELLGSILVPQALHQDIEHSPVLIHGPPEIMALPIDREEDFIQMPLVARLRTSASEFIRIRLAALAAPLPDRFISTSCSPGSTAPSGS